MKEFRIIKVTVKYNVKPNIRKDLSFRSYSLILLKNISNKVYKSETIQKDCLSARWDRNYDTEVEYRSILYKRLHNVTDVDGDSPFQFLDPVRIFFFHFKSPCIV